LRDVPRLIIEHNIHGIDIDPRAVQIAGLSLWLRAQRSWQEQGVKPAERPTIRKSNIVCAEPMPGDKAQLDAFLKTLRDERLESLIRRVLAVPDNQRVRATPTMADALCDLVRVVWEEMKLAGEAGSLLKIEESLATAIQAARDEWEQQPLFRVETFRLTEDGEREAKPKVNYTRDAPGQTADFWTWAETLVLAALAQYAEQATGDGYARRLFAADAARGFAFIDVCRKRYDVALMNPPFGDLSINFFEYGSREYLTTKYDLGTMFIERCIEWLLPGGQSGWITSRTWMALSLLESFRTNLLFAENRLALVADFGIGVLEALVETAACVIASSRPSSHVLVFRLLDSKDKERDFNPRSDDRSTQLFVRRLDKISNIPRSAFGYWLPEQFVKRLSQFSNLEHSNGSGRQGLATTDDFRFLRAIWEIPAGLIGWGKRWIPLAKGGEYEPYYDDIHLAIDYERDGSILKTYLVNNKNQSHWSRRIASSEYYGLPGLTYPERTTSDLSLRPLPEGSIFTATGQAVFLENPEDTLTYLGLSYTRVFKMLVELFVGGGDASESGSAARHYTSGIMNEMPIPHLGEEIALIGPKTNTAIELRRRHSQGDEASMDFIVPTILPVLHRLKASDAIRDAHERYYEDCVRLLHVAEEIDDIAADAYGIDSDTLDIEVCPFPSKYPLSKQVNAKSIPALGDLIQQTCIVRGYRRAFTKKAYWSNRMLELMWHRDAEQTRPDDLSAIASTSRHLDRPIEDVFSYALGSAWGRWNVEFAVDKTAVVALLPDPFAPLPSCPPGMLQNAAGLPATPGDVPADYPLRISWPGILVDDPGHREDIVGRVREALAVIWPENHDGIEQEACQILGVASLRDYFGNANRFFDDHLKRYSKSRRQAPIYWPLSTLSGSYTLWIYYHRLTDQMLYTCVVDFVDPKLKQVGEDVARLRQRANRSRDDERELTLLSDLERELKEFRAELLRLAPIWKPNLNDGVQITAAPLWKLFAHRAWQRTLRETWETLEAGDYDWAHLAMSLWPARVVPKCTTDRSLAIAHDVEDLFWVEDNGKWRALASPDQEIAAQRARHTARLSEKQRSCLMAALRELADGPGRGVAAVQVAQHLTEGAWDDTELALLCWPARVAEKCLDDPALANTLRLNLPPKRTKSAVTRWINELAAAGCPDLAGDLLATLESDDAFERVLADLEAGRRDAALLALPLWPQRVIDRCLENPELAAAHDLRKYFWVEEQGGWRRRREPGVEVVQEIARRK
jgi:hypothetical protein